jgi:hypothetical protein
MQPHCPGVPPPPQVFGAVQAGQLTVRAVPQLSITLRISTHGSPRRAQIWASVSGTQTQALFWQVRLGATVQEPQSVKRATPQLSKPE